MFINYDKDIAAKMFGYRIKFEPEKMTGYMGCGTPSVVSNQDHKPLHFWA
jgi:hypothetical protein